MTHLSAAIPLRRLSAGDRLVHAFLEAHAELVTTLYCLLGNYEDAQDATQEAFLKCWRARGGAGKIRNCRAWVFRVGLNAAKDLQRSAWRRRARPLGRAPACADEAPCPPEQLVAQENVLRLRRAIRRLRPAEREVFLLRQNGDLTYEEIAVVVRRPVGTVKTQMRAALQKLGRVLNDGDGG